MNNQLGSTPLERIPGEAMIGGVAAGLARHFGWNRTVVRLIFIAGIFLPHFPALLIYIILWIAMPKQAFGTSLNQVTVYSNPVFSMQPYNPNNPTSSNGSVVGGIVLIVLGVLFLLDRWFDIDFGDLWPFILIAVGLWLIFRDRMKTPYDSNNTNNPL
ncbi:PspC domain-containing protein [Fibrisoma montanum]|uniref:PspC domain-containing protein n=1 Tax=Fibrisoma montanum TaxID=2305895 RepID=A0A418M633_9BACT|nr:PspC domain-containing protein [Fibrisoma montanum]RIV21409.1 PspC domain-containing protein [Fibrisoma montanum]